MPTKPLPRRGNTERRLASRSRPELVVLGVDLTTGATVQLYDFSARSFAVESADPMTDSDVREFEFPLRLGRIAFKGRPKRRQRIKTADGRAAFLVAFEFTWKTPTGRLLVDEFVRSLRGSVA